MTNAPAAGRYPRSATIAAFATLVATACVYALRLDRAAGLVVDDAWYVLLGEALARGDGYRLISSVATPILPVVPPGFPALLSLVFRVSPAFPQNVLLLKGVSIAAMFGVGLCTYRYFVEWRQMPRPIGVAIAAATLLTPGLVFLATSTVMAECVFMLCQLLTVFVVEQSVHADTQRAARRRIVLAAVLAAAAMLARSAGIAVIVAVVLYLLGVRRVWLSALFAAVTFACLLPWTVYEERHAPTREERLAHGGSIAFAYTDLMRMRSAADPTSGHIGLGDLPSRVANNVVNVFGRDTGGILLPVLYRGPDESGEEVVALGRMLGLTVGSMGNAIPTIGISLALSAIMLIGYVSAARVRLTAADVLVPISLAMVLTVPVFTFRYVIPLTPFLIFYLIEGLRTVLRWSHRATGTSGEDWPLARIALFTLIGLNLYDHVQYIVDARNATPAQTVDWIADAREVDAVLNWMKQELVPSGAVASTNPALVYLATGRKAVAIDDYEHNVPRWKASGIRYAVALRAVALPDPRFGYKVLYQSPRRTMWVIEI
jgi:hypothetical protein